MEVRCDGLEYEGGQRWSQIWKEMVAGGIWSLWLQIWNTLGGGGNAGGEGKRRRPMVMWVAGGGDMGRGRWVAGGCYLGPCILKPNTSATSCFLLPYLAPPLMEELKILALVVSRGNLTKPRKRRNREVEGNRRQTSSPPFIGSTNRSDKHKYDQES
ncbi:hypothetical protein OSB04_016533 [Centaurea solstitialis]|uniref:Uncharacterized protein n=1 Tax=Centaurea solstitialis TaxID=347529 RepID=A0AA38TL52_9ASTR|nr:hypothetical protein OSB04_016533 [Centaurea solstitialis]